MVNEIEAQEYFRMQDPYRMEVSTVDARGGKRNDQIDVWLKKFQGLTTAGDIYGITSVVLMFEGGIIRIHFSDDDDKHEDDILRIAKNIQERRKAEGQTEF